MEIFLSLTHPFSKRTLKYIFISIPIQFNLITELCVREQTGKLLLAWEYFFHPHHISTPHPSPYYSFSHRIFSCQRRWKFFPSFLQYRSVLFKTHSELFSPQRDRSISILHSIVRWFINRKEAKKFFHSTFYSIFFIRVIIIVNFTVIFTDFLKDKLKVSKLREKRRNSRQ
jgi:hypothetical protein